MKNLVKAVSAAVVTVTVLFVALEVLTQQTEYVGDYDIN